MNPPISQVHVILLLKIEQAWYEEKTLHSAILGARDAADLIAERMNQAMGYKTTGDGPYYVVETVPLWTPQ